MEKGFGLKDAFPQDFAALPQAKLALTVAFNDQGFPRRLIEIAPLGLEKLFRLGSNVDDYGHETDNLIFQH
jgi:hypothetical protein